MMQLSRWLRRLWDRNGAVPSREDILRQLHSQSQPEHLEMVERAVKDGQIAKLRDHLDWVENQRR